MDDPKASVADTLAAVEEQTLLGLDGVARLLDPAGDRIERSGQRPELRIVPRERQVRDAVHRAHRDLLLLLTRHTVAAADLRLAAALLHACRGVDAMCDDVLDLHGVGRAGLSADGDVAVLQAISWMRGLALHQVRIARDSFGSRDVELANTLSSGHAEIEQLNRDVVARALVDHDGYVRREKMRFAVLASECLARVSEQAVEIGEQIVFVVDGLFREVADSLSPLPIPARSE